jgi:hypothetical protein
VTDFLTGIDITTNTTYADVELVLGPGLNLPRQMVFPTGPLVRTYIINTINNSVGRNIPFTFSCFLTQSCTFTARSKDVIEAIQHAKDEGLTVSIIATGHSYT